ncbi:hypothetical protein [Mycolicibacterium phocaicum]|uniref:Uncharacterized protein n=1 Tax=Mycolicibacterium phocaicum TaxID=319706 RepID=A0A7I7ZLU4_9MYCO|nr:hypothetical protein [Mycolicibacterium phocaicum]TLH72362.1 hypothetical protein C1S79_06005 [Mycolicibacterium phocaicum]BBZ55226.1 hypothetical protein MPHO_22180 [Mycolicibacterium phocaicum]
MHLKPVLLATAAALTLTASLAGCSKAQIESTTNSMKAKHAEAIDACALLSDDEIAAYIPKPFVKKPTGNGVDNAASCNWENPDNYKSVTLDVGPEDSAPGNTLPSPKAGFESHYHDGPDGLRSFSGQLEFPASNRHNYVQVVANLTGDADEQSMLALAKLVSPRIPS